MSKSKSSSNTVPFNCLPFNEEYLSHLVPAKPSDVIRIIKLFARARQEKETFLNYWDPKSSTVPMLLLIGTKGIGKSSIVTHAARIMEYELRRVMTGDGEAQDLMGVVDPLASAREDAKDDQYNRYRFSSAIPLTEPEGKGGLLLADDIGSLDPKQQKVFRALITEGYRTGWFGETLAAGWNWIATSNPESDNYFLVNEIEESLRDRCIPVLMQHDQDETIYYLASSGMIPDVIHKFLLMNKSELEHATPRRWEQIGQLFFRNEAERAVPTQQFVQLIMRGLCPPGTIDLFTKFLAKGDDPNEYPMLTKEILGASKYDHKVHVERMHMWARNDKASLIAATSYDIQKCLGDEDYKMTKPQIQKIADIVDEIAKDDLAQQVIDAATGTGKDDNLIECLKNRDLADRLCAMQDRWKERQKASTK